MKFFGDRFRVAPGIEKASFRLAFPEISNRIRDGGGMPTYTQKEFYNLWYEYLSRSPLFRDVVKWYREILTGDYEPYPDDLYPDGLLLFVYYGRQSQTKQPIAKWGNGGFIELAAKGLSFDDFWQSRKSEVLTSLDTRRISPDNKVNLKKSLQSIQKSFLISLDKGYFAHYKDIETQAGLVSAYNDFLPRALSYQSAGKQNFQKQQNAKIKKRRIHLGKLKRYLEIYDYRNQDPPVPYFEILEKYGTDDERYDNPEGIDYIKKYQDYRTKAWKIIKGTQKGVFPALS